MKTYFDGKVCLLYILFLLVTGVVQPLQAQRSTGTILGTIQDSSRAAIPAATIVARHVTTGVETELKSSEAGFYTFPLLTIGEYVVKVSKQGFKTLEKTGVHIVGGETLTLNIQLEVGEVSETITVSGELDIIDYSKTSAGATQVASTLRDLPLQVANNARRSLDFLATMPGVTYVPNSGAIVDGIGDAGPHRNAVMFSIDGQIASVNLSQGLRDDTGPIPDFIQEFRLSTNMNAENGWTEGTGVELITKSGTNQYHGTVYEYFRNNALDSRGFLAPTTPPKKQNEYGFVFGGPIIKNKLFIIGGWDEYKLRTSGAGLVRTVPTALERTGNFSELLGPQVGTDALGRPILQGQIYDPATTRPDGHGGFIRDPFPGNIIPAGRFSSISTRYQSYVPNPTNAGLQSNWIGIGGHETIDRDRIYIKADAILGRHNISFAWEYTPRDKDTTTPAVGWENLEGVLFDGTQYRYRLSDTISLKPNLILSIKAAINNVPRIWGNYAFPSGNIGQLPGALTPEVPNVVAQGTVNFGGFIRTVNCPQGTAPISIDLSWVKGSHNFKFGGQYMHQFTNQVLELFTAGQYNFINQETALPGVSSTGAGYASYLLGSVDSATTWTPRAERATSHSNGYYAQDQWRVNSKLTLNYGFRWNIFIPFHETYQRTGAFTPSAPNPAAGGRLGALQFWGDGPGRNGMSRIAGIDWTEFAPRFGAAYALDSKTVLRAYYGVDYYPLNAEFASGFIIPNLGFGAQVTTGSTDNGVTPLIGNWDSGVAALFPAVPNLNPSLLNNSSVPMLDPNMTQAGRVQSLGAAMEREVGWGTVIRAEYVGKLAHGIPTNQLALWNQLDTSYFKLGNLLTENINSPDAQAAGIPLPYPGFNGSVAQALRPYPQYQNISLTNAKNSYSLYHSLQVTAQKRYGNGLSFLVNYTFSKILTPSDSGLNFNSFNPNGTIQHVTMQNQSKMLAQFDRTNQFKASYSYELPFGKNKPFLSGVSPFLNQLVGGWTFAGILIYSSGTPVTVTSEETIPAVGPIWPVRVPNVPIATGLGCSDIDFNSPTAFYLNRSAFEDPAPYAFGNTRVLPNIRTCGTANEDLSILKDFPIRESLRIRFGTEFFNAFNRHAWTGLNSDMDNVAGFGRYTGVTGARTIQFSLKFDF